VGLTAAILFYPRFPFPKAVLVNPSNADKAAPSFFHTVKITIGQFQFPIDILSAIIDSGPAWGKTVSLEDRIRKLAEDIITCEDDGKTAVLAEELQDAIRDRVIHLRNKHGAMPLWQRSELAN
jgi:hypothetical protein